MTRKVVLGTKLGTTLPPAKDPRVDSPEPFPAVIPGPEAVPDFRASRLPHIDRSVAKWISIVTGVIMVMGSCTAVVGKVWQDLKPRGDAIESLKQQNEELKLRIDKLANTQARHIEACESFRQVSASAWRTHPNGEVKFRGVDGNIRLEPKAANPPVSEVGIQVVPLPNVDR